MYLNIFVHEVFLNKEKKEFSCSHKRILFGDTDIGNIFLQI